MNRIQLSPHQKKKRLRWLLLFFFIAASIPVYFLLQTVYVQLEKEAYFNAKNQAEKLIDQVDLKIQHALTTEQNRPIAEYQFFNVMENPLLSESSGIKFSPLSEIPPKTDIKGIVGYFQINTDGSFHLPALPEIGQDNISGLSLAELENRLELKKKLRNLLSIKIVNSNINNDIIRSTKADKTQSKSTYREEFTQQRLAKDVLSTPQPTLTNIQQEPKKRIFKPLNDKQKTLSKQAKKYKTRKEIVQLPDQNMASSYFNRNKNQADSISPETQELNTFHTEIQANASLTPLSAIHVLNFESEVTPLQLLSIGQEYFCFYRYVWHDKKRYTQGFIVKSDDFLKSISQQFFYSSGFSSLFFSNKSMLLKKLKQPSNKQEYPLHKRNLSPPFQQIELLVNAEKLNHVAGNQLINILAISIYCIFFLGFIAFYRLGGRQIDLAKQQQNFISSVSHELKTPLTSIRMYGEMLRSGWVNEKKKQGYYNYIFFESERLSRLITNVLQLAKLDHQTPHSDIEIHSAYQLFQSIPSKIEAQIESANFSLIPIQTASHIANKEIKVDEDAFFQIIINLIDNAIKFTNNSAVKQIDIACSLSSNNKQIIYSIRDYGPGIKNNQKKLIFQLFYRAEDEMIRKTPGTGIGLALVAQLAASMNAKINVVNKEPGAEFQISFAIV